MAGHFSQDLRQGLRMWRRNGWLTAVIVATLAVGIAASSSIFSVVNGVLLKPLPYHEPDHLVVLHNDFPQSGRPLDLSIPEIQDLRDAGLFDRVVGTAPIDVNLTEVDQPERVETRVVTASFFDMLGVQPELGRAFLPEEDLPGVTEVAVISHELWQRRFGGDANAVGRTVRLDDDLYTIVGVAPRGFQHPEPKGAPDVDVWIPGGFVAAPFPQPRRFDHSIPTLARLKPGSDIAETQAALDVFSERLAAAYPEEYPYAKGWRLRAVALDDEMVGNVRPALLVLLGAVALVLLIACANVANLLLARGAARGKEIAIRAALGATRGRLVRQLLVESLLLSVAAGAAGLLLSVWGVELLVAISASFIPRSSDIHVDASVLAFTALASVLTGVLFGAAPALQASKADVHGTLKDGGRTSAGPGRAALRGALVVSEVALALVLMIGAGLLVRSFVRLQTVEPGFDASGVLTAELDLPHPNRVENGKYFDKAKRFAFFDEVLRRVSALPGVEAVGLTSALPVGGTVFERPVAVEGQPVADPTDMPHAEVNVVGGDYFGAMGIRLASGRAFGEHDDANAPIVIVVNEAMARRVWPGEEAIGKRVAIGAQRGEPAMVTVVGVVGDVKARGLEAETPNQVYVSFRQTSALWMTIAVRTSVAPASLVEALRAEVQAVDPDLPLYRTRTMEEIMATSVGQRRFGMLLLTLFAGTAVLLAGVGIYSVISYSVSQRTREIGVRMALGARARDVYGHVLGNGMALAAAGTALGLVVAAALARLMSGLLFGVSAYDPVSFALLPIAFLVVALAACLAPARRAARVDPLAALRSE